METHQVGVVGGRGLITCTIHRVYPPPPPSLLFFLSRQRLYSFGYGRVEVLSGFVNSLFLVSIATAVLSEALTRLLDPPTINTDKLLVSRNSARDSEIRIVYPSILLCLHSCCCCCCLQVVSVAGFLVNLVGIATFSTNSHGHSHGSHGHSHNTNMQGR